MTLQPQYMNVKNAVDLEKVAVEDKNVAIEEEMVAFAERLNESV